MLCADIYQNKCYFVAHLYCYPQEEQAGITQERGPPAVMLDRVLQLELRTIRLQSNASQYSFV